MKLYILREKYFTLNDLNNRIDSFPYRYLDLKSKPSLIQIGTLNSEDNRLKQSASQMMVLLLILPFILSSNVDTESDYFEVLQGLMDIIHIIFSPIISYASLSNLKYMINDHLLLFKRLFPNCSIIPKQHYLIHLPTTMKKLGPSTRHWCMRFEGKHVEHVETCGI